MIKVFSITWRTKLISEDGKDGKHPCRTYKIQDAHRYLEVAPKERGQLQYLLLQRNFNILAEPRKLVALVHQWTHATPATIQLLMQCNNEWHPNLKSYVEGCGKCDICLRTGELLPSRKISISHMDCKLNASFGVDFLYWLRSPFRTLICLHGWPVATGFDPEFNNSDFLSAATERRGTTASPRL